MPSEADEYECFNTWAELLGYISHKRGEARLRAFLEEMPANVSTTRELLEKVAAELREATPTRPAEIVLEFAAQTPSELDARNPWEHERGSRGSINWRQWRRMWHQRHHIDPDDPEGEMLSSKCRERQKA